MEKKIKKAIKKYQCSGCIVGGDIKCFSKTDGSAGCSKHYAGTMISGIGTILLGMPKGFNRLGAISDLKPVIFEKFEDSTWNLEKWNIPVWKHLNKKGYTMVRGLSPRTNNPFIHIYLENCMDKINCKEITEQDIKEMD